MAQEKLTKNERRDQAREQAAKARAAAAKRKVRNRIVLFSSIGLIVVALGLIVTLIVVNSQQQAAKLAASSISPKNMASGGLVFTSTKTVASTPATKTITATKATKDKVKVDIYLDFQCPYCKALDVADRDYIATQLDAGKITYEVHPLTFINEYSQRSANAFACVANKQPEHSWDYMSLLYDRQPEETKVGGLPNSDLGTIANDAGVDDQAAINCITSKDLTYEQYLQTITARATANGAPGTSVKSIQSTPTVFVDNKQVQFTTGYLTDFQKAVDAAAKAKDIALAPYTATSTDTTTPGTTTSTTAPSAATSTATPSATIDSE